jgi:predicted glycoside hydrolase/deacetylase ChbG (UPF0249 family)
MRRWGDSGSACQKGEKGVSGAARGERRGKDGESPVVDRTLMIVADDFGMAPGVSSTILSLAAKGVITGASLLVNSPYAEDAVRLWKRLGAPCDLGWHPCLTMDAPLSPVTTVRSLTDRRGAFTSPQVLLARALTGRLKRAEIESELTAQLERYCDLVGGPPSFVNGHHHIHVFPLVASALEKLLARLRPLPFVRRVEESIDTLLRTPGARAKRSVLKGLGALSRSAWRKFPCADALIGITPPTTGADEDCFARWIRRARGRSVELMCHPGADDDALGGREGPETAAWIRQRQGEAARLADPRFMDDCRAAGFRLMRPTEFSQGVRARVHRMAA